MAIFMANKAWLLGRLKQSLELLAAPAHIQLREPAASSRRADELYLSFKHWRLKSMGDFQSEFATDQLALLDSMEQLFACMGPECWTDEGVTNSTEWKQIRLLSGRTLQTFG
jgi:hypothetical protein